MTDVKPRAAVALKWSALAELAVKMLAPLSTMLLARILSPDAFGVAAVAIVVSSLAGLVADSGFHKFVINHDFRSEDDLLACAASAHLYNILLASAIFGLILFFRDDIASLAGIPGNPDAVTVAAAAIPFTSIGSIPAALAKRDLDFKSIFKVRILSSLIPFAVTVPSALIFRSYIAIVIGFTATHAISGIMFLALRHNFLRSRNRFNERRVMIRFSIWSTLEALTIWLTSYADIFIVSTFLSRHYVGIYRTAIVTSGQILGLVTASVMPVLYSSLSRAADKDEFRSLLFGFQKSTAVVLVPAAMALFLFSGETAAIFLGEQWTEASLLIGLWSLSSIPVILISHFSSEIYRAIGKPEYSAISQLLHLAAIIPVIYLFIGDFGELCHVRAFLRLQGVIVNMIILQILCGINTMKMLSNILFPIVAASSMILATEIPAGDSVMVWFVRPAAAVVIYLVALSLSPENRSLISGFFKTSTR